MIPVHITPIPFQHLLKPIKILKRDIYTVYLHSRYGEAALPPKWYNLAQHVSTYLQHQLL